MNEVATREADGSVTLTPGMQVQAQPTPSDLLRIAVEQGADLDRLERLMALQERWEAGQAKRAYDQAFAAFKAEAVKIVKNRTVTDGPLKSKRYAELHAVVNAVTPALSRNGLSSSWKLTKDEPNWIEVTCYLKHVAGHCETMTMGGPPDAGGAKNAIQARASTVSYLERYTLKGILGLSEEGDDNDGAAEIAEEVAAVDKLIASVKRITDDTKALKFWKDNAPALEKSPASYKRFKEAVAHHRADLQAKAQEAQA